MSKQKILNQLKDSITRLDDTKVYALVKQGIEEGLSPSDIINEGLNSGLTEIGEGVARGERFLNDLMVAGDILTKARETLRPLMEKNIKIKGNVMVVGTVEGCFHILPNEIISATFAAAGFRVINIGVNCSAQQFVQAVKEHKANVLGMSALLSGAIPYFKVVVDALKEAGLRDEVVVIIGGCHMDSDRIEESGADCYGVNAVDGLHKVQELLAEKKRK